MYFSPSSERQSFTKLSINNSFCISDATFLFQHVIYIINLDANASSHQQLSSSSAPVSPSSSSAITTQALITNCKILHNTSQPNPTQPNPKPPSFWPQGSIPLLLSPSASVSSSCRFVLHLNFGGVLCKCGIRHSSSTTRILTLSKAPQI